MIIICVREVSLVIQSRLSPCLRTSWDNMIFWSSVKCLSLLFRKNRIYSSLQYSLFYFYFFNGFCSLFLHRWRYVCFMTAFNKFIFYILSKKKWKLKFSHQTATTTSTSSTSMYTLCIWSQSVQKKSHAYEVDIYRTPNIWLFQKNYSAFVSFCLLFNYRCLDYFLI